MGLVAVAIGNGLIELRLVRLGLIAASTSPVFTGRPWRKLILTSSPVIWLRTITLL